MQQHLQEHQVILSGRIKTAAAAPELAPWRVLWLGRLERPVFFALMHADQARPLRGGDRVIGVRHTEWCKDVLAEINLERQPADRLDHSPGPIEVDPVLPALARVENQWQTQRGELAGIPGWCARCLDIAAERLVPDWISESCS